MANRYWVSQNTVVQFSVAAQNAFPNGLFFKPDGTKMYLVNGSTDNVQEYNLSLAWNISTASFLQNFSVTAQEISPNSLSFKDDGTKMYITGTDGSEINEYTLSSAWDISTASYVQNFSVSAQDTQPVGLFFKPDGTKMYVCGDTDNDVNEYTLSSAWDISTASYVQNFSVATQDALPRGIFFKDDGTKMYIVGDTGNDVNEYNLSVAWDISTASYVQVFSVASQGTQPWAIFFKPDGTKMYLTDVGTDTVYSYPLSTAWNISTVTIDTWDGTAGTKWAATSGGTGGETVPTTADDVFFDANSLGIVTIASGNTGAKSINCTGFTGTLTGNSGITVAGSITLVSGMTYSQTGTITITGTGTIISAGKNFGAVTINGSGITVTLGDALNAANRTLTVTQGTFDTAGYALSAAPFVSNNSNTRTINFNSSTVTVAGSTGIDFTTSTNLTFNAGTSQINIVNSSVTVQFGSQTFYNVSFTSASTGTRTITGANTFNNLTLTAGSAGLFQLSIADNQTVSGTLTCAGVSVFGRGFVRSDTLGTTRTITAAAVSATDCDFRDITIAGAAAPISPTRAGDCGNNSGITFPAAKNSYRVTTSTTWSGSNSWALTSGAAGSDNNFPLAQDTAIINEDTTLTGTLALAAYNIGSIDCSARTTGITLSYAASATFYGSYTLGSGVTISGTASQTFSGRGTQTFTSAGKTITFPLTVDKPAGAFELGDAYNSSNIVTLTRGTFDAKNYNLTFTNFISQLSNVRTINMGSGLWTLSGTGAQVWDVEATNLTLNKSTANILLSNTTTTARSFGRSGGAGISYNKLTIGGATGTSVLTLISGTFTELASTKTVAHTVRFSSTNVVTIDTWSVTGTAGNLVTVDTSTAGIRRTFTLTNSTAGLIDYLSVKDIGVASPNLFYVGDNSTDGGNNLNVYFRSFPLPDTGNMFFMFN